MKEKHVDKVKALAHFLLFVVSLAFTVTLFSQYSAKFLAKTFWITFAVALEVIKLYLIYDLIRLKLLCFSLYKRLPYIILYVGIAFTSGIATLGFALNSIQTQSFVSEAQDLERSLILLAIETEQKQIDTKLKQQTDIDFNLEERTQLFSNQIENHIEVLRDLNSKLQIYDSNKSLTVKTMDTFTMIGELPIFNKTGEEVLFFLMLLAVIMLEVSLVLTAGNVIMSSNVIVKREVEDFVDCFYQSQNGALQDILKISNISEDKHRKILLLLLGLKYKGHNLFTIVKDKYLRVNKDPFSKENREFDENHIKKIIALSFDIQKG